LLFAIRIITKENHKVKIRETSLDKEAKKIGVTRQSIIKVWIAERLKEETKNLQAS